MVLLEINGVYFMGFKFSKLQLLLTKKNCLKGNSHLYEPARQRQYGLMILDPFRQLFKNISLYNFILRNSF